MILKLSRQDRKMISAVAVVFRDMTAINNRFDDRYYDFWRISMYSKVAFLKKRDIETIHVAMKSLEEIRRKYPNRDPKGEFRDLPEVIQRLEDFMIKKGLNLDPQPKSKQKKLENVEEQLVEESKVVEKTEEKIEEKVEESIQE